MTHRPPPPAPAQGPAAVWWSPVSVPGTGPAHRGALIGVAAAALLVAATLVYYLLILLVSRRWSGGRLVDGSSADWYGLRSVAVMTASSRRNWWE